MGLIFVIYGVREDLLMKIHMKCEDKPTYYSAWTNFLSTSMI
jgi:hypothetical protein